MKSKKEKERKKKVIIIERASGKVVAKGWVVGRNEERLVKGTDFQL